MSSIKDRLTTFIRQYYLNKIIKGSVFLGIAFIALLLFFVTIEYFGWFNTATRAFLFYFYIAVNALVFLIYVLFPLSKLTGLSKGISMESAARIIGQHFEMIRDKLLNLLQLQELNREEKDQSHDLVMAAIEQKEQMLQPFPFIKAIGFRQSLRYLRLLVPGIIILIAIVSFRPDFISEPVYRISRYNKHFEKPAPFTFLVLNEQLTVIARERFVLRFTTEGSSIPDEAFVEINGINYKAGKPSQNFFELEIPNLREDVTFRMNSLDYYSKPYTIRAIPRPAIRGFKIKLEYPHYTRKENEVIENVGDLIVPRGTKATWSFLTHHADNLLMTWFDKLVVLKKTDADNYIFSQRLMEQANYSLKPVNQYIDTLNEVTYSIEVIPDEYPGIRVDELFDSLNHFMIYFTGEIADDYGLSKLQYVYTQVRGTDTLSRRELPIRLSGNELKQRFMHFMDLRNSGFQAGDQLVWFFEVTDNDMVSGPKSTRSYTATYKIPGYDELNELQDKMEEDIKSKLEKSVRSAQSIQQEAKKLTNELRNKEQLNWQDREKVNQLLNHQQEIKRNIEELQKMLEHKNQKEQTLKNIDEDLLEKQKMLQDLMDKLLDEETKKLLEEIQKLMDNLDKNKMNEMLEKIRMTNDELNRELERNLELFKQLEIEKDLRETIEELGKLAREQNELAKDSEKNNVEPKKISEEQEQLNRKFDQLSEKLDKIQKNNQELEFPNPLQKTDEDQSAIKKEMKESLDQLNQGKPKNAGSKQRNASQKMEELSDKLSDMYSDMMEEQIAEDIMTLRQILKNLIHLSFEQETLMKTAQQTSRQDPKFPELINKQNLLKRDFQIIEDSLVALGKRQTSIQGMVSKEISSIKENMDQAISNFLDVHTIGIVNHAGKDKAVERQQYAMTSMNNLALLLAEALDNMKDEQSQQKSGKGKQCKKPKSGGSMSNIRQRQQNLNKQLLKLKDEMEKGQQQGKRNSMSEQFARMAAEQEAIRKALGEYMQELQKQGLKEKGNLSDLMKQMEKTEEELVNKILNNNTLKRQNDITTRLLESEKAERERDEEERRESKEVKNDVFGNPSLFLEYKRLTEKDREMLRYSTPLLHLFYKNKVNDFMIKQEEL